MSLGNAVVGLLSGIVLLGFLTWALHAVGWL
jgi:hypothetical protein